MAERGRPTIYSDELAALICERLAEGKSLVKVSREYSDMPALTTIFRWLADKDKVYFRDMYTKAMEIRHDVMAEEILDISDNEDSEQRNTVNRDRLRVDSRKWLLARLAPRKYGDKIEQTLQGPEGEGLFTRIERVIVDSDDKNPA